MSRNLLMNVHDVYTQRNNALYPDETCWPTSAVQAMHIRNITMPRGKYDQDEDNLADFCMRDARVKALHNKLDPNRDYKPWQVHDVLCEAINLWVGYELASRHYGGDPTPYIDDGKCVVLSGKFPYYSGRPISHAICVHGYDDKGVFICDPWGDYEELYASGVKCVRNKHMPWEDYKAYMGTSLIVI